MVQSEADFLYGAVQTCDHCRTVQLVPKTGWYTCISCGSKNLGRYGNYREMDLGVVLDLLRTHPGGLSNGELVDKLIYGDIRGKDRRIRMGWIRRRLQKLEQQGRIYEDHQLRVWRLTNAR